LKQRRVELTKTAACHDTAGIWDDRRSFLYSFRRSMG
jgi:hypothetical protein